MTAQIETHEFQAEARQLLQLMVHSIYSNKDIFLRELVSNASDALDKLRLESFRDKDLDADIDDLRIDLEVDRVARTLTVRDNGIGMSRDEVVDLIGTIAKSGTAELLRSLREAKQADGAAASELIGQFGVGFYSAFMVADSVTLVTRKAGQAEAVRWASDGTGTYTLEPVADAPQGTAVTLHLKPEDAEDHLHDYTAESVLREIVRRYSDFVTWPIRLEVERTDEDGTTTREWETVNSRKALWARPKDEVSDEEYREFYKHISHDWLDPLRTISVRAEGTFEYQALLFLPSRAPADLYYRDAKRGVQLYVKRVFIMDNCEALVPDYLRFVKGVVDAQDLSLNVSREILQQDRHIQLMRRRLVKKVLAEVKAMMSDDRANYDTFWREFGSVLKEGLVEDPDNSKAILDVASFASTHDAEEPTTLRDYVERTGEGQDHIYYLTGASRSMIENSPHMEAFRAKGLEVLVLTDPIDEFWVEQVGEYEGKTFQSIAKGQVDLDGDGEDSAEADKPDESEFDALREWLSTALADDVKEVRLSSRLTSSPACLVGDTHDLPPALVRMYQQAGQEVPVAKRILELNPKHALVTSLRDAHGAGAEEAALRETAELLHGMALLAEGSELPDPQRFTTVLASRLTGAL
ncbi:molecular chaperone HtpG [Saccharomonospora piscinae]|uniref:Chaperone protein HtpG n=1 Tax=Saccharomonospora piscinae TaxID=687388 RepID=A0A1V9ACF7_SACPI|nr:molecular chaperone HtpG [Saccharomonospora piscinae]OQO94812.1 molecular chaperone HtpG [Saccharomonospora piscinae]TLW94476.1 molecular chaperone HtpG [Saccharomonospora piscinae]